MLWTRIADRVHDVPGTPSRLPQPPILVGHSMGAVVARCVAEHADVPGLGLVVPAPLHGSWRAGLQQLRTAPLDLARSVVTARTPARPGLLFTGLSDDEQLAEIA